MNKQKVALITGAAGGIGQAVVEALQCDYQIVATDIQQKKLIELKNTYNNLICQKLDITQVQQVEQLIEFVETQIGPIHLLVNTVGVLNPLRLLDTTIESWTRTIEVNLLSIVATCRAVSSNMIKRNTGCIINIGSNAATTPRVNMGAYCASKAALIMYTKCLGLELAQHNIRCNAISPGSTDTDMLHLLSKGDIEASIQGNPDLYRLGIPLGRIAQTKDIANFVRFLSGQQALHITMGNFVIDGGATLGTG